MARDKYLGVPDVVPETPVTAAEKVNTMVCRNAHAATLLHNSKALVGGEVTRPAASLPHAILTRRHYCSTGKVLVPDGTPFG